jgi:hypothetical protein
MRTVIVILVSLSITLLLARPGLAVDVKSRLFVDVMGSNWEDAMARMDAYVLQLQQEPDSIGVIIVYGGSYGRRGEPQAWGKCLQDYVVNRRGIDANRIILLHGGYRETLTAEMWITVSKEYIPKPGMTIDPKRVKFRKGKIKSWRSLCNI